MIGLSSRTSINKVFKDVLNRERYITWEEKSVHSCTDLFARLLVNLFNESIRSLVGGMKWKRK